MRKPPPHMTWLEHHEWEVEFYNREKAGVLPHFILNIAILFCLFVASIR